MKGPRITIWYIVYSCKHPPCYCSCCMYSMYIAIVQIYNTHFHDILLSDLTRPMTLERVSRLCRAKVRRWKDTSGFRQENWRSTKAVMNSCREMQWVTSPHSSFTSLTPRYIQLGKLGLPSLRPLQWEGPVRAWSSLIEQDCCQSPF